MELTREKVLAMELHELSIEVAERIFKARIISKENEPESKLLIGEFGKESWKPLKGSWLNAKWRNSDEKAWIDCPQYAADISAAWGILELPHIMDRVQLGLLPTSFGMWMCRSYMPGWDIHVQSITAADAICKAALLSTLSE